MNRLAPASTKTRSHDIANVLLILLGFSLAALLAGRREMWLDEYHTWYVTQLPLPRLYRAIAGDAHPPLYFVVMRAWTLLFGDTEMALRSFSLLCHLAASAVFVPLAKRISTSDMAATSAIGLFALSPALVHYATEVRMYALAVLLACLTVWQFVRTLDRQAAGRQGVRSALLVGLVALMLFLTHYTGLFFVFGLWAYWFVWCVARRTSWRPFFAASLLLSAGLLAWAPVLIGQRAAKIELDLERTRLTWATAPAYTARPATVPPSALGTLKRWSQEAVINGASIAGVYPGSSNSVTFLIGLPFLLVGFGILLSLYQKDSLAWGMMLVVLAVTAGGLFIPMSRRYLLVCTPALMVLINRGLDALNRKSAGLLTIGAPLAVLISFSGVVQMVRRPSTRPIASVVQSIAADTTNRGPIVLVSNYGEIALRYHARAFPHFPKVIGFPEGVERWWRRQPFQGWGAAPISADSTKRWIERLDLGRAWLLQFESQFQDPWDDLPHELRRTHRLRVVPIRNAADSDWLLTTLDRDEPPQRY